MAKYLASLGAEWLVRKPEVFECTHLRADEPGIKPIFFSGWKNTRVFAWVGLPEGASAEHPVPGIVLVHGGGGTAFLSWVRWWNSRGYAAIAADNCGAAPVPPLHSYGQPAGGWPRHSFSGAPGWGAFDQGDLPPEDQWFTHAVSAVIFSHNLLRAMPEVDPERIGITGVSWGAVLSCIVCGIDPRFKAHIPVYGCGFLTEASRWTDDDSMKKLSLKAFRWWKNEWDPSNFLENVNAPTLWFAGTGDSAFYVPQWQKSSDLIPGLCDRALKLRWPHAHGHAGESQPEFEGFFAEHLKNGHKRIKLHGAHLDNGVFSAAYFDGEPRYAELMVCTDGLKPNQERDWHPYPAAVDRTSSKISADLPKKWFAAYLSVIMPDNQYVTSSVIFAE